MVKRKALIKALIMTSAFGCVSNSYATGHSVAHIWQQSKVEGVVSDGNGPVSGASILVKGTTLSTSSDEAGRFSLSGLPANAVLQVSYVGFETQEVRVGNQSTLNIQLISSSQDLEEVVVVAYGTAKKSTFTGSASVVKSDQIEKISGTGFAEALQGMSAGVNVSNNEGNPGGDTRIQIRGISSMSGSSNPLYVVDGMPYDGQLNSIAQSDIESITVLKDAAASSLYGSRAANGVVVITTKRGKSAKPTVNFRSAFGTSDNAVGNPVKATPSEQFLNTWEGLYNDQFYKNGLNANDAGNYASENVLGRLLKSVQNSKGESTYVSPFKHINEQYVLHDGNGNAFMNPNLEMVWDEKDYDMYNAVFSRKLRQDHGLDVSGTANEGKTNYFLSAGYLNDNGYANKQYFKRYNFRTSVTTKLTDWLEIGGNISYSQSRQNVSGVSRAVLFSNSLQSPWLRNVDNTDWEYSGKTGERMLDFGAYTNSFFGANPMAYSGDYWNNENDESFTNNMRHMISSRFHAGVDLPFDIKFKTSISLDNNIYKYFEYTSAVHGAAQLPPYGLTAMTAGGAAARRNSETKSVTFNNILTWEKGFGSHNLSLLAGQESYSKDYYYDESSGEGIMQIGQYELGSTTRNWQAKSNKDRYALMSFFGKVDYNYDNKYFLSGSVRRDGSSRFSPDSRWGNFYSAGLSWRLSNEDFLKDVSWLSNLSYRASYGTTGNDKLITRNANGSVGDEIWYAYQGVYSPDDLYTIAGLRPTAMATRDLKWEKNQQFNTAIDFSFFNRIHGSIEYYQRQSKDLLFYKSLPLSAQEGGIVGRNTNLGNLKNSGFEFTIGADAIRKENFNWKIDANLSTLKNEITSLPDGEFTYENRTAGYKVAEGKSLFEFFMVKNAGVNPENGNMQYWIRGNDNDWVKTEDYSQVTTDDYQWLGSALPKVYGSVTNSFDYKGFDFSFMLYYSLGAKMYDFAYIERSTLRNGVGVVQDLVADRWQKPGDQASLPRWSDNDYSSTRKASDFYLFDNDFLRLRNVTLGYKVPATKLSRLGIANLRLFVSGDNLLTFGSAKKRYSDPETGLSGNNYNGSADTDNGIQGSRRVYTGGVQITF
ncbi:TonB-dependent receptor [Sphingobacterium sp. UT-1RO-CII-1]|uniref:SusC/RagA family TonB-linked outer membrane protein n=1 Tax=Sphingobacterium sp. UT-1RO-CII-1 TaxID=2995225 RepID=UPI00227C5E0A|nr:TonB-dependent receptor [Sphingobacterium sp. UT-1RO-CII-1]MCY4780425.1 TonB-dependent receptor [Sphingobacterium sp. UT-1RO-CII-1]